MRSAPTVVYPVGRCAFFGRTLVALGMMGGMALSGWVWTTPGSVSGWGLVGGSGLLVFWALMARREWSRTPAGSLQWDSLAPPTGETGRAGGWRWLPGGSGDGVSLQGVEVVFDFQHWILLRWREPQQAACWAWVERHRAPARWRDLRRALMASAHR